MEHWRLIAFAIFMIAVVAAGWMLLQRRRRAQQVGNDPVYGVASLAPETIEGTRTAPHTRGVGTSGD